MKRRNLGNCTVDGCSRSAFTREMCSMHYQRMRTWGTLEELRPPKSPKPIKEPHVSKYAGFPKQVVKTWHNIQLRCTYPGINKYEFYGGRGIENRLSLADLHALWIRDNAEQMEHPSIDRIDRDGHYEVANCRFIEFQANRKLAKHKWAPCTRCGGERRNSRPGTYNRYAKVCIKCRFIKSCAICNREFQNKRGPVKFCSDCRFVTRPCAFCRKPVVKDRGKKHSHMRNKQWFCSKSHQGKWLASRYGWRIYHAQVRESVTT